MGLGKPKIVIWCGEGANQKALVNKINAQFNVEGVVIDIHSPPKKKTKQTGLLGKIIDRIRFKKIYDAWKNLMTHYDKQFPAWSSNLKGALVKVRNINDEMTGNFTEMIRPDLIIVSGTALIKKELLSKIKPSIGIINLHTGLSPYVKGGPNCTNWCIANNEFHLVGNTIMWLNEGIDSGDIIATETVNIQNAKDLAEAHKIVMEHAHDLYLRAIDYLVETAAPYTSVPQNSIAKGELYLTKMWTTDKKKLLLKNWKRRNSFANNVIPKTVSLRNSKSS